MANFFRLDINFELKSFSKIYFKTVYNGQLKKTEIRNEIKSTTRYFLFIMIYFIHKNIYPQTPRHGSTHSRSMQVWFERQPNFVSHSTQPKEMLPVYPGLQWQESTPFSSRHIAFGPHFSGIQGFFGTSLIIIGWLEHFSNGLPEYNSLQCIGSLVGGSQHHILHSNHKRLNHKGSCSVA